MVERACMLNEMRRPLATGIQPVLAVMGNGGVGGAGNTAHRRSVSMYI